MVQKIINRTLNNFFNSVQETEIGSGVRFPIRATIKLILENQELFSLKTTADAPTFLYNDLAYLVMSKALKTKFDLSQTIDDRLMNPKHYEDDYIDLVVNELVSLIKRETEDGSIYIMYAPIILVKAIDPVTYQPQIAFKTRYGLVKK